MLVNRPEIVGKVPIPETLRSFQSFSKDIVTILPELEKGTAICLRFEDDEQLRIGRKQILTAGMRTFGSGRVQTGSSETLLYVWMKDSEVNPDEELKKLILGGGDEN